jgi:hypothetical protein
MSAMGLLVWEMLAQSIDMDYLCRNYQPVDKTNKLTNNETNKYIARLATWSNPVQNSPGAF